MLILLVAALATQPPASAPEQASGARQDSVAAPQRRLVSGSISNDDYPAEAIREEAQGTTVAGIAIAPDGRVTDCRVEKSAGHAALDAATCTVLVARMRFEPAATTTTRSIQVAWILPEAPDLAPVPFASSRVIVQTSYPASGPAFCRRLVEGKPPAAIATMRCAPNADAPSPPSRISARMTNVEEFIAGGQPLPVSPLLGERFKEQYRLRVEVDQRGAVTRCEQIGRPDEVLTNRNRARSRCRWLLEGGRALFEPGDSAAVREGVLVDGMQLGGSDD